MNEFSESLTHENNSSNRHLDREVLKYQEVVEQILEAILEKECELNQISSSSIESATFDELINEYSEYEQFVSDICQFAKKVEKCQEDGHTKQQLNFLTQEDREEIGIHKDTMTVIFSKIKLTAFDKMTNLKKVIEKRQQDKIDVFNEWLTELKAKIARINPNIGPDIPSIKAQVSDLKELQSELEQKQEILNFMENFIIFDDIDPETLELKPKIPNQFDDELVSINRCWTHICRFVKQREDDLVKAKSIWSIIINEGPELTQWLSKLEHDLNEMLDASRNVSDSQVESAFMEKLLARSSKLEQDIKKKQIFYTSLEHRVRNKMQRAHDTCPLVIIEVQSKLDELQDYWNLILNRKRTLDYKLQALTNNKSLNHENGVECNMIPVPDSITKNSSSNIRLDSPDYNYAPSQSPENFNFTQDHTYNSNDLPRGQSNLSNSTSEYDGTYSINDNSLQEAEMSARNRLYIDSQEGCVSNSDTTESFQASNHLGKDNQSSIKNSRSIDAMERDHHHDRNPSISEIIESNESCAQSHVGCRVEAWKNELESCSIWLKSIETSLGMNIRESDREVQRSWNDLDLEVQINLLTNIEQETASVYGEKFDLLLVEGHKIIDDFTPEIDEEDGENLRCMLEDFEQRYETVRNFTDSKKSSIVDGWKNLSSELVNLSDSLIEQMSKITPEGEMGVDLITLAQQQDELLQAKASLNANDRIAICIQEVKLFLKLYDDSKQRSHLNNDSYEKYESLFKFDNPQIEELREEIENQYDRLSLHLSELLQLIDQRLELAADISRRMHLLQVRIQDMSEKLQVAEILKSMWGTLSGLTVDKLSEQLEDLKIYRDHLCEIESIQKQINYIVECLLNEEIRISQQNLNRINELNIIWQLIDSAALDRQKQIEQAFEDEGSSEQKFLACTVDSPWERRVATTSKVPYFKNCDNNETRWDHPKLTELLESMKVFDEIVFSAYRTAMKLRFIQSSFCLDMIMLEQMKEIFKSQLNESQVDQNQHPVSKVKSQADILIGIRQIIGCLESIYNHIKTEENSSLNVPVAIDLTLNWLLNLYDRTRTGYMTVLTLKIALSLLCCATLEEKYNYMYQLVESQGLKNVDDKKMAMILEICTQIPTYLGDEESFGGPEIIETSVRDCLANSKYNPDYPTSINQTGFLDWFKSEPKCLIWLPVFHRILISENERHSVRCRMCRAKPIVGLRYKCLKSFKFDLCQNCFLTGRHVFEIKNPDKHLMHEYCYKTSSGERFRHFAKILRNKIKPTAQIMEPT